MAAVTSEPIALFGLDGALRGKRTTGSSFAVGHLEYDDPTWMDCP
jgi:hypothetical protein